MGKYIIYRVLLFIPTLLVLALATFFLSKWAPGDPVALRNPSDILPDASSEYSYINALKTYRKHAHAMGLHQPVFYLSISNRVIEGRDQSYVHPERKACFRSLAYQSGSGKHASRYYDRTLSMLDLIYDQPDTVSMSLSDTRAELQRLQSLCEPQEISSSLDRINRDLNNTAQLPPSIRDSFSELQQAFKDMSGTNPEKLKWSLPLIKWNGTNNQFHHWLTGVMTGDMGASYKNGRAVAPIIWGALKWTLLVNGLAILVALLLSIPLGVYSAVNQGGAFDKVIHVILLAFYAIPVFWTATVLLVFFTTPEYGSFTDLFPSMGVGYVDTDAGPWEIISTRMYHLFLPVVCLSYPALAFLTRQMRSSMRKTLGQEFIRQARAMGIRRQKIIWDYAFKNALFPMITLLGSIIPATVTGSLVVEVIFAIPGTGNLLVESIFARDWPVVYGIVLIVGAVTVLAFLIVDILYHVLDPRTRSKLSSI